VARSWLRYRPTARFADPWVDACRLLIPIDTFGWPAASQAHAWRNPAPAIAVTVDLNVGFHRPAEDEWLLAEAVSPVATGGLASATGRVWDQSGRLLASGGQTMLCRPALPPG
jgi:acyl-CoA thioesterase